MLKEQGCLTPKSVSFNRIEWFLAKHREAPSGTRWQCFHRWGEQRAYVYVEMGRDGVIGGNGRMKATFMEPQTHNDNAMQSPFVRKWAKAYRS